MRAVPVEGVLLHCAAELRDDEAREIWAEVRTRKDSSVQVADAWVVKLYPRRPKHHWLRRLMPGRAAREAAGYAAFAARSLPTPRLLLWAEQRRMGLHELGLVVTARVDAPTAAEAYRDTRELGILEAITDELASIHRADLAHGDAVARNFLATRPRPLAFDLPSWGRLDSRSQTDDLQSLLGSVRLLTGDGEISRGLLQRYEAGGMRLPHRAEALLALVEEWLGKNRRA